MKNCVVVYSPRLMSWPPYLQGVNFGWEFKRLLTYQKPKAIAKNEMD